MEDGMDGCFRDHVARRVDDVEVMKHVRGFVVYIAALYDITFYEPLEIVDQRCARRCCPVVDVYRLSCLLIVGFRAGRAAGRW